MQNDGVFFKKNCYIIKTKKTPNDVLLQKNNQLLSTNSNATSSHHSTVDYFPIQLVLSL